MSICYIYLIVSICQTVRCSILGWQHCCDKPRLSLFSGWNTKCTFCPICSTYLICRSAKGLIFFFLIRNVITLRKQQGLQQQMLWPPHSLDFNIMLSASHCMKRETTGAVLVVVVVSVQSLFCLMLQSH